MHFIRYAIRKHDLHALLRAIGLLKSDEQLMIVDNVNLLDPSNEDVLVLVSSNATQGDWTQDLASWSDRELEDQWSQLALFDAARSEAAARLQTFMQVLQRERDRRAAEAGRPVDDRLPLAEEHIPPGIDQSLTEQIFRILEGGGTQPESGLDADGGLPGDDPAGTPPDERH